MSIASETASNEPQAVIVCPTCDRVFIGVLDHCSHPDAGQPDGERHG